MAIILKIFQEKYAVSENAFNEFKSKAAKENLTLGKALNQAMKMWMQRKH